MHLVYLDESGQTGANLTDPVQPIFVLGALVVPESTWLSLEKDLQAGIDLHFPEPRPDDFEIHASEISNARKPYFKRFPVTKRLAFGDDWFRVAHKHQLKLVYRAIAKRRFATWCLNTFGKGVSINPHVAAFPLVARVIDDLLRSPRGLRQQPLQPNPVDRPSKYH